MNRRTGNTKTAWLLLALYVSMLLLSSVHIHPESLNVADDCEMCMKHETHGGHLSATNGGQHACLLCQFLSITYPAIAVAIVLFVHLKTALRRRLPHARLRLMARGIISLRAPPFSFVSFPV